eukprot:12742126-Alexandrium_andersonii.AAC.1
MGELRLTCAGAGGSSSAPGLGTPLAPSPASSSRPQGRGARAVWATLSTSRSAQTSSRTRPS